ncbi:MAG TPA: 16S rRNA (adenine(1518)-N(6)/adenine(1519)-N(6))-dimethyltransferase RsmA [Acidobacteriaceae bacterium]|nr:16S rRNA (adenine(1518)-N(6)/adenine(1519)-N(6))-dimethyltransferase RsmA [Acidobacteriaceae bacterium]
MKKPKLGQHFLVDEAAQQAIVDALGNVSARTVIEIGAGHGAITSLLAMRCRRLIALEIDPPLAAEMRFRFRDKPQVEIVEADVLEVDMAALIQPDESADVVGNLPYYITSPILMLLFAAGARGLLARAVLMMQREVADRLSAAPGCRDYGLLSATTQIYARVETLFHLPPAAFAPPPQVSSSVLRLEFAPRFVELGVDPAGFDAFLRTCFAQKRKTLANNLRSAGAAGGRSYTSARGYTSDELRAAWPAEIPPLARAESLALEPLAALYRALMHIRQNAE